MFADEDSVDGELMYFWLPPGGSMFQFEVTTEAINMDDMDIVVDGAGVVYVPHNGASSGTGNLMLAYRNGAGAWGLVPVDGPGLDTASAFARVVQGGVAIVYYNDEEKRLRRAFLRTSSP